MDDMFFFKYIGETTRDPLFECRAGTSTIELAFVLPILLTFIVGTIDISSGFAMKLKLEQAAARGIEHVSAYDHVLTDYSAIVTDVATASGQPVQNVVQTQWLECDGVRQPSFSGSCASHQQIARYVSVSVSGEFYPQVTLPSMMPVDANGGIALAGDASVRVQ